MTAEPSSSPDKLPKDIEPVPQEVEEVLEASKGLPSAQRETVRGAVLRLATRASYSERYTSPLPPAWLLREYEDLLPGCMDRILTLTEQQQRHRHKLESQVVSSDIFQARLGLSLGFVITMTAVVCGTVLIAIGRDIGGFVLAFGAIATLAGVFVYAQQRREAERKERMKEMLAPPETSRSPDQSPPKQPVPSKAGSNKSRKARRHR